VNCLFCVTNNVEAIYLTFPSTAYKRENIYRKPAEECYDYIKKKLGGLSTQRHAPQIPTPTLKLYIGGLYRPRHNRPENLYSESIFSIHKLVIRQKPPHIQEPDGETKMEKALSSQKRKKLQRMVLEAFKTEIRTLPPEIQYILTDDLVTAFQNRLTVFQKIQKTSL